MSEAAPKSRTKMDYRDSQSKSAPQILRHRSDFMDREAVHMHGAGQLRQQRAGVIQEAHEVVCHTAILRIDRWIAVH